MADQGTRLGLRENWRQFTLLVIVNAFVGGMVGLERAILPQYATEVFGMESQAAILSFITAFGLTKAAANYFTGRLANRFGRRRLLLAGWALAIPVPILLIFAPDWSWVVGANVLLGLSQGLTWSSTVVMKMDLVGEKNRGLAMGLNEFAGYLSVGLVALATGLVAHRYGVSPYPFYIGIGLAVTGFLLTLVWVRDTRGHVQAAAVADGRLAMQNVFWETSFLNRTLSSVTQAGLVNNLNDGMIWGLLPIMLASWRYDAAAIGLVSAVYPTVWGLGQLVTGKLADHVSKKQLLFWGMLLQGIAILLLPMTRDYGLLIVLSAVLGIGTAMVYPTFLATIAEAAPSQQRAESVGTFRLWRDLGYALGAILSGLIADQVGIAPAIWVIGGLTVMSAGVVLLRMPHRAAPVKECVEAEEVQAAMRAHRRVVIIDVRSPDEFAQSHIPEAHNLALHDLQSSLATLRRDTQYVMVCGKGGGRSSEAAQLLRGAGLHASWLCGGTFGWMAAG